MVQAEAEIIGPKLGEGRETGSPENGQDNGADNYAKEVLYALEERISTILSQVRSGLDLLDDPSENITVEKNQ